MSRYVTNFESLLLKEFPSNGMTKPLNAIISVAIFPVIFPLQRKEAQLTATRWDLHRRWSGLFLISFAGMGKIHYNRRIFMKRKDEHTMLRKRPFLLLTGIALFLSACLLLAGHILSQPDEPVTIATVEYGQKYWGTGISYTRIIELQHSGEHNGTLITTYECATSGLRKEKPGYNIHVSRDGGSGWEFVTTVRDQTPGLQSEFNPFLYELPQPVGDMPAGTLLLAGLSIDAAHDTSTVIQLYRSHDAGRTWALYTSVAEGSGIGAGIWEPWLMVLPDGRLP